MRYNLATIVSAFMGALVANGSTHNEALAITSQMRDDFVAGQEHCTIKHGPAKFLVRREGNEYLVLAVMSDGLYPVDLGV